MNESDHLVLILDDDESVLESLKNLMVAHGFSVRLHADSKGFFEGGLPAVPACLVLDHELGNGETGVQVYAEMLKRDWNIPTVFLTAHWNVQSVVSAMRSGADGFISKPFDPAELVAAVKQALQNAVSLHENDAETTTLRKLATTLTVREREIVILVVKGLLNKEIADQLKLALVTIKVHRGRAMQKLGAGNPAELARIAAQAGIV